MIKNRQLLYYSKVVVSLILALFILGSLDNFVVQADQDENKSVAEGYKDADDGQAPNEEKVDEGESIDVVRDPQINNPDEVLPDQSLFGMFVQLFLALAVIIIMIYALIKFIGKRSQSYQNNRMMQNIGGVHVGTNRSIQIIRVGKRILIVGVGESIQLLKEIDDENEVEKILEDYVVQEVQEHISSVFQWVQSKISRQEQKNTDSKAQFKNLLENQLTGVKNAQKQAHAAIKEKEQQ